MRVNKKLLVLILVFSVCVLFSYQCLALGKASEFVDKTLNQAIGWYIINEIVKNTNDVLGEELSKSLENSNKVRAEKVISAIENQFREIERIERDFNLLPRELHNFGRGKPETWWDNYVMFTMPFLLKVKRYLEYDDIKRARIARGECLITPGRRTYMETFSRTLIKLNAIFGLYGELTIKAELKFINSKNIGFNIYDNQIRKKLILPHVTIEQKMPKSAKPHEMVQYHLLELLEKMAPDFYVAGSNSILTSMKSKGKMTMNLFDLIKALGFKEREGFRDDNIRGATKLINGNVYYAYFCNIHPYAYIVIHSDIFDIEKYRKVDKIVHPDIYSR